MEPPQRHGFGRTIVEQLVAQEFGAEARVHYDRTGFRYEIDAPMAALQQDLAVTGREAA